MGIKCRDLVGFGLRHPKLLAKRPQMARRDGVVAVLNEVQIFDEKIMPPGPVPEKGADFLQRFEIELASLGEGPRPLARADMSRRPVGTAITWGLLLHAIFLRLDPLSRRPLFPGARKQPTALWIGDTASKLYRQVGGKMPKSLAFGQPDSVPLTLFFGGIPGYIPYGRKMRHSQDGNRFRRQ